jgi:hypothetical protein
MSSLLRATGPPGAGKSTVVRILADRYEPSVRRLKLTLGALVDPPNQPETVADAVVTGVLAESWVYRAD